MQPNLFDEPAALPNGLAFVFGENELKPAPGLPPRSAYVLRGEVRWRWQHSVQPTQALRYSITFRTRVQGK